MGKNNLIAKGLRFILEKIEEEERLAEHQEVQLAQWTLEDGQTIVEAESFEAGQNIVIVVKDDRIPLPVGEYKTSEQDGGVIIVVRESEGDQFGEGVIAEIREGSQEEEEAPEEQKEVEQEQETPTAKKVVESVSKETHFSQEDVDTLNKEITDLKLAHSELEGKFNDKEVELAQAIATKDEVELKLSKAPTAKKIANAPTSSKKQINFNSQAKTVKGRILEGLQNLKK